MSRDIIATQRERPRIMHPDEVRRIERDAKIEQRGFWNGVLVTLFVVAVIEGGAAWAWAWAHYAGGQ